MPGSQGSFEDRIGKFKAGNTLIQGWADYNPVSTPLIAKAAINAFVTSVENANISVTQKEQVLGQKQDVRSPLVFTIYDTNSVVGILNPDCAEQRIIGVHAYVNSIFGPKSTNTQSLKTIIDKIRPRYKGATSSKSFTIPAGQSIVINNVVSNSLAKNTGNVSLDWNEVNGSNPPETVNAGEETTIIAPSGVILVKNDSNLKAGKINLKIKTGKAQTNSPSEKTFVSMEGVLTEVIAIINGLGGGVAYTPPDPKLTVAEITALHGQIVTANSQVQTAMNNYGEANRLRKELYDGLNGMADRITMIKSYLSSFPGKKKSNHFIEFSQAIKGT